MKTNYVIFTDLDGTLLDHETYSFEDASESLELIRKHNIPLILCSSKTKEEIIYLRKKLNLKHPFIVENGGAVYIPKNYFDFKYHYDREDPDYNIIEFGTYIDALEKTLKRIKNRGIKIISFIDMTPEEISKDTGLGIEESVRAGKREYDIPFKILDNDNEKTIKEIIKKEKLNYTKGGRYSHIMGDNNKGKAVRKLMELFRKKNNNIKSIALGDSQNDFPMLDASDVGILVKRPDGSYSSDTYRKAQGVGPTGWNKAILELLEGKYE